MGRGLRYLSFQAAPLLGFLWGLPTHGFPLYSIKTKSENKKPMHRIYAYLNDREFSALTDAADPGRGGLAKFVREAVQEKLDRDRALENSHQVKDELASLVDELRDEIGRVRKDVAEDTQRSLALIREDAAKSLRKTEEMQKTFVLALAASLLAGLLPAWRAMQITPAVQLKSQ